MFFIILLGIKERYKLWKKTFETIHQLSCFVGHFDLINQKSRREWNSMKRSTKRFDPIHKTGFPILGFRYVVLSLGLWHHFQLYKYEYLYSLTFYNIVLDQRKVSKVPL